MDKGGYLTTSSDGHEVWRVCECQEQTRIERLFRASQITPGFQHMGFKNFDLERPQVVLDAYMAAADYYKAFHEIRKTRQNSIALLGAVGSGKTHLLMAVANNLIKQRIPVIYFPWVEGFNNIKDDLDRLDEKVTRLQMVDVLYIDDLFKGRTIPTAFQLEQLFAIVNYRYLNNLPILVSSERDIDEISDIDDAVGSRIYEMTRDYNVTLRGDGLNYRLEGRP